MHGQVSSNGSKLFWALGEIGHDVCSFGDKMVGVRIAVLLCLERGIVPSGR